MAEQFSEAMCEVVELSRRMGVETINNLPGCWEVQLDEHWWIAANGHRTPTKCSRGPEVPPFTVFVEFNGFPAGLIDPYGGVIAAGEAANEAAFIAAIKAKATGGAA